MPHLKLLPYSVDMYIVPDTEEYHCHVIVGDDVAVFSAKDYYGPRAQDLHYQALVHVIAITRRVLASYEPAEPRGSTKQNRAQSENSTQDE